MQVHMPQAPCIIYDLTSMNRCPAVTGWLLTDAMLVGVMRVATTGKVSPDQCWPYIYHIIREIAWWQHMIQYDRNEFYKHLDQLIIEGLLIAENHNSKEPLDRSRGIMPRETNSE